MNIQGLDYNTQRPKLRVSGYGREIQQMVEHCMTLPTKEERLRCAKSIIATMDRMTPNTQHPADRMQTLWDHLALMSDFKLDIDYPVEVASEEQLSSKPERIPYPDNYILVRHYGKELFLIFDKLKEMEPGMERDELVRKTANQMKRCLMIWGRGNSDNEKVADDLARFTDGIIQLDLDTFTFDRIDARSVSQENRKKKRK